MVGSFLMPAPRRTRLQRREIILGLPGVDVVFDAVAQRLEFHDARRARLTTRLGPAPMDEALAIIEGEAATYCAAALWIAHRRQRATELLREWFASIESEAYRSHAAEVGRFYRVERLMCRRPVP